MDQPQSLDLVGCRRVDLMGVAFRGHQPAEPQQSLRSRDFQLVLVLVALGQMAVITTGDGNIDLSIASVMTLSAYVALIVIGGHDSRLLLGVVVTFGLGLLVGSINAALVLLARIPAIIATLATGYVLATASLLANRAIPGFTIAPTLREVATARIVGVPIMAVVAAVVMIVASLLLNRTAYGRTLSAVGQNALAARLAGVRTIRVAAGAFLASSVLAAFTGLLLGRLCRRRVSGNGATLPSAVARRGRIGRDADLRGVGHRRWHDVRRGPARAHRHDHADCSIAAGNPRCGGRGRDHRSPRPGRRNHASPADKTSSRVGGKVTPDSSFPFDWAHPEVSFWWKRTREWSESDNASRQEFEPLK